MPLFDDRYRICGTLNFACTAYNASIKIYNCGFFLATLFLNLENRDRAYVNTGAVAITFFRVNLYLNHAITFVSSSKLLKLILCLWLKS